MFSGYKLDKKSYFNVTMKNIPLMHVPNTFEYLIKYVERLALRKGFDCSFMVEQVTIFNVVHHHV